MAASRAKGPSQELLERLDSIFGPEYFKHARILVTAARDLPGIMKVAHRLQAKLNEGLGGMVEVIMEHVKHEWWVKLHETTMTVGLHKGAEVMDAQVTHIPDGIRVHPYKRDHMPTLEILLLWEDAVTAATRGYCLHTVTHPQMPALGDVDSIYASIEPFFAKRWCNVSLRLAPPIRGEFELADDLEPTPELSTAVGSGVELSIIACHAYGFARDQVDGPAAHVTQCKPMVFRGATDASGLARICFLPAEINKIQVQETSRFHGSEIVLPRTQLKDVRDGPTNVEIELIPKASASTTVNVFQMPRKLPAADDTDGVIDWAAEKREHLADASVEVTCLEDGAQAVRLTHVGGGAFIAQDGGLPEGFVNVVVACAGYESEERALMLLIGENDCYVPLRRLAA